MNMSDANSENKAPLLPASKTVADRYENMKGGGTTPCNYPTKNINPMQSQDAGTPAGVNYIERS